MAEVIKKAVIPVAGLGTRFLPASKSIPKELTPIGTTPILHMIIEEAAASGIEEIIFVTSPLKAAIKDYVSTRSAYCMELAKQGKRHLLDDLHNLLTKVKFQFVTQDNPKGLGDAVMRAEKLIADEVFCVMLPDNLFISSIPCTKQLIEAYKTTKGCVNAAERVPLEKISSYGVYAIDGQPSKLMKVKGVVEKPKLEDAPSDIAVTGRYLFTSEVFDILKKLKPGRNGEIQLADAQDELAKRGNMYALLFDGFQIDTGDELGYLKANIHLALSKYRNQTIDFIKWLNERKTG